MRPSITCSSAGLWVWLLLAQIAAHLSRADRDPACQDERPSLCRRIGTRFPASKCYKKFDECCDTCTKLLTDIPGCPFGDRVSGCGSIGGDRPVSDCYAENATCCGTCAEFSSGTPGCEFGDRLTTCSDIGIRYSVSSCYQEEQQCCDTCSRFRSNIPGCEYGDRENWCSLIGVEFCQSDSTSCCSTCAQILSTSAAPPVNVTMTTTISGQVNHETSVQMTYSGSPGRPESSPDVGPPTSSPPYTQHSSPVTLPSKTADLNSTNSIVDKSPNKTNSSDTRDRDVICYNVTGHRIRHSKHGGRHRSRGHGRPLCVNVTSPGVPDVASTSEPLWLIISKGMPPQTSTTTPSTARTVKPDRSIPDREAGVTDWEADSTTPRLGSGWLGEMDYQEDHMSSYNSASHHSKISMCFMLQTCVMLFWSRSS